MPDLNPDTALITVKRLVARMDLTVKSEAAGTFEAVISSETPDRQGDVLIPRGMIATEFMSNPVCYWQHNYSTPPLAMLDDVWLEDKVVKAKGTMTDTDMAKELFKLLKSKVVRGVSVGFKAVPGGTRKATPLDIERYGPEVKQVYSKWKLAELSFTSLPVNPEALIYAVEHGELDMIKVKSMFGIEAPAMPAIRRKSVVYFVPTAAPAPDMAALTREQTALIVARIQGKPYL
jgi:HK97 family phage prohead protease